MHIIYLILALFINLFRPDSRGHVRSRVGYSLGRRRTWFATPMTRDRFVGITALGQVLRSIFDTQISSIVPSEQSVLSLYNVQQSNRAVERNQGVGGFGNVPEYRGAIEYDDIELGYQAAYQHKEFARGMAIERKLLDDDEMGVIRRRVSMMGLAFDRTIQTHAASTFNNAFNSGFSGADGKPLCATDHPLSPTNTATWSNKGTAALSHDALTAARVAMGRFTDARGNPLYINPDVLLVPVELFATAQEITRSDLRSDTPNNAINVNRTYRVISTNLLSDSNNWFLIDSRMAGMYLNWYWRVQPEFVDDPTSDFNLVIRYRGYMRYSFGWDTPYWVYGSEVS